MKSEAARDLDKRREAPLRTPTDLGDRATKDIAAAMNAILADVFAIYIKTKNFHWHMSGPHFRDYHLMLDEQSEQIFAMTDDIAERDGAILGEEIEMELEHTRDRFTAAESSKQQGVLAQRSGQRDESVFLSVRHSSRLSVSFA